ncbi:MAG: ATP-binding protein [Spirulinaceae cyanobacterium]
MAHFINRPISWAETYEKLSDWFAQWFLNSSNSFPHDPTVSGCGDRNSPHRNCSMNVEDIVHTMWQPRSLAERLQTATQGLCRALDLRHSWVFNPDATPIAAATPQGAISVTAAQNNPWLNHCLLSPSETLNFKEPTLSQEVQDNGWVDTLLTIPLRYQEENLGLLCLHRRDREALDAWPSHQLPYIESIALQCAIALHQNQLDYQLHIAQQQQELIGQLHQLLNTDLSFTEILQKMMQSIGEQFTVERVVLLRFGEENVTVEQEWRKNANIPSLLQENLPCSEWQELLVEQSDYQVRRYLHIEDYPQYCADKTKTAQIQQHSQTTSLLSVPLFQGDRLTGSLTLESVTRSRHFNPTEIQLLIDITSPIAIAFHSCQRLKHLEIEVQARSRSLEAANHAKSELLSTMSHELRTPLTSIIGFSRMLLEQIYGDLNLKQDQYVKAIFTAGEHLLSLINDLLDISKIEAEKEELALEPLAVEEVCRSAISLLQEQAHQAGLDLNLEIHPEATLCYADQRRLKQILVNLLSNAIKFTETGSVTLKVTPHHNTLNFAVIDTGIGLKPEDLENLFQPFYQGKTHRHSLHKGTGLGLALSRKLARLHHGDLTVESELNQGSCFTLKIPLNPPLDS